MYRDKEPLFYLTFFRSADNRSSATRRTHQATLITFREWRVGARVLFSIMLLIEQADTCETGPAKQNAPVFLRSRPRDPV